MHFNYKNSVKFILLNIKEMQNFASRTNAMLFTEYITLFNMYRKTFMKLKLLLFMIILLILNFSASGAEESKIIACISAGIKHPFWELIVRGVKHEAIRLGYQTIILDSDDNPKKQVENTIYAISQQVKGIIISPTNSSSCPTVLSLAEESGIPVVIADIGTESGEYISTVISNNRDGAYKVGELFAEQLSMRKRPCSVGIIAIDQKRLNGQARTSGFVDALSS